MKAQKIITIITIIIVFVLFCFACKFERTYSREHCQIVSIENENIIVEDESGNLWSFEDQSFSLNDIVTLTMDTNNTDNNIKDDIIIKVIKE